ncbi:MAG: cobaltochelatase subunit CobN, partial [Pseudomonadota bacterium]
ALSLKDYNQYFIKLPKKLQTALIKQWGAPEKDPLFRNNKNFNKNFGKPFETGGFMLPAIEYGHLCIALQPARGYQIDPVDTYHDPDLVPPHHYLAFYIWLQHIYQVDALIQFGKHGNLEWLPGKSLCLSKNCWPEAVLGPIPLIYPFIVNDPGEGSQAKRRSSAVIIDHMMPPLMRAELDPAMIKLERLLDEYFDAMTMDPRRQKILAADILDICAKDGLNIDCRFENSDDDITRLVKLDRFLCDIKETQIRGGLHIFGQALNPSKRAETLVALTRIKRHQGVGADQGLIEALAIDLGIQKDLSFGDLESDRQIDVTNQWNGPKPLLLKKMRSSTWRNIADTIERLELLALEIVRSNIAPPGAHSKAVLDYIQTQLSAKLKASIETENKNLFRALSAAHIDPGPSGAPSRGRHDILPTGRNFFSVDTRALPTPAAWTLGFKSAQMLARQYAYDHGEWPRSLALSAWGTANMRTGGDDIAQALALIGAKPIWDAHGGRVTGFEILPTNLLNRPRIDVTLRISGFFRDAFPQLIDLFDSAVKKIAQIDEPDDMNPIAAHTRHECQILQHEGLTKEQAFELSASRIFGSKPGSYGAGLQAPIDSGRWQDEKELSETYISWSGYVYRQGQEGKAAHHMFRTRLSKIEAVIHNQDNREHDILDSDDYYQFEGGLANSVYHTQNKRVAIYHNDHSNPEKPRIDRLENEITRILHARLTNPKWIDAAMQHGYKGGFEMAAGVDYLFAFKATTDLVHKHHFDKIMETFVLDDKVRNFLLKHNKAALHDIAEKLLETLDRNYWQPRKHNDTRQILEKWKKQ